MFLLNAPAIPNEYQPPKLTPQTPSMPPSRELDTNIIDLKDDIDAIKSLGKSSIKLNEQNLDRNQNVLSTLFNFKQQLASEKISLEATLTNLIKFHEESSNVLQSTLVDISSLQKDVFKLNSLISLRTESILNINVIF